MNYNSIIERIVTVNTYRFICMLAGIVLLLSCGADNDNANPDGDAGKPTNQYLQLQPNGLNVLKVSSEARSFSYPFQVKVIGSGVIPNSTARIASWTEDELKAYNNKEKTSYKLLPSSSYSLSSTELTFGSSVSTADVEVKFDPSKVFSEFKETGTEYLVALKLSSADMKVRDSQSDLILPISFDYPVVDFTNSSLEVSINKDFVPVSIGTTLDYKVNGETVANPWDFVCSLAVPSNALELVAEYNENYKTSYQLLPAANYDLGEGVTFKAGEAQGNGEIMIKREGMAIVNHLLPLKLGKCSNEGAVCRDGICYLKIGRTYTNPIISETSAADPTVIRAQDGYFYLYATQTEKYWVPIYRSKDLVHWEFQKTAFRNATKPTIPGGGAYWAPEIRYINNKYVLYFSWAKWGDGSKSYTAVATSDSPLGDFPDSKALITNEEFGSNVIDQFYYEDGGKKYMFFGSFNGIFVTELTDDGLSVKRDVTGNPVLKKKVCGNAFEATNIYKKNGYYYLFASIGSCCDKINSTYKVVVGRSKELLGPYVDKKGKGMLDNSWELVLEGDMQKWIGPGHNSEIIQDDEGTEWMIYHSYLRTGDTVGGRLGMLDRLQWTNDGWPYIMNCVPSNSDLIPVFNN